MTRRNIVLLAGLAGILACSAGIALYAGILLNSPAQTAPEASPVEVLVRRGDTLRTVLYAMHRQGVLRHPGLVYLVARLQRRVAVRSGCYLVDPHKTPWEVLAMLANGQVILESFTVAEGLNRWQVRDILVAGRWMQAAQFDALCDHPAFLAAHRVPGPTCEGYLFPETYKLTRGLPPDAVLAMMFTNYQRALSAEVAAHGRGPRQLPDRALTTLASIVEKETGAPQERAHIACVFYNRLAGDPPWRLETDPTVIYAARAADAHFDGNLTRAHLRHLDSPYNTYRIYGLPPGPIANPGRAALAAVVQPSRCTDFFFVSTNNGRHIFCPTLGCHNKAVRRWQVDYFSPKVRRRRPLSPSAAPP